MTTLFYVGDGLLALPRPSWIQAALDVLIVIFYRVDLQTNANTLVGMVCHPCNIVGGYSEVAYTWRHSGREYILSGAAAGGILVS